jgi:hypothetical protein
MTNSTYKPTQLMLDWHAALLEPGRKQATGRLGKIDETGQVSNCCLGVLSEVAGNVGTEYLDGGGFRTGSLEYNGPSAKNDNVMPSEVLVNLTLGKQSVGDSLDRSCDINLGTDSSGMTITGADLNDDFGFTFAEIAEQIRIVYIEGTGNHHDYEIHDLHRHQDFSLDCD